MSILLIFIDRLDPALVEDRGVHWGCSYLQPQIGPGVLPTKEDASTYLRSETPARRTLYFEPIMWGCFCPPEATGLGHLTRPTPYSLRRTLQYVRSKVPTASIITGQPEIRLVRATLRGVLLRSGGCAVLRERRGRAIVAERAIINYCPPQRHKSRTGNTGRRFATAIVTQCKHREPRLQEGVVVITVICGKRLSRPMPTFHVLFTPRTCQVDR